MYQIVHQDPTEGQHRRRKRFLWVPTLVSGGGWAWLCWVEEEQVFRFDYNLLGADPHWATKKRRVTARLKWPWRRG